MQSLPRKWVLKPLSPRLEQSDLRSIVSPGADEGLSFTPDRNWGSQESKGQPDESFESISVSRTKGSVTVSSKPAEDEVDVVVQSRQVSVVETAELGEDHEGYAWSAGSSSPSTPGTPSSTSSHTGFYSFVEDPASPEAERNEEWMVSPERQAKLATLKRESSFKVQTYALDRKPEKLFEDSNGDSHYRVEKTIASAAEEGEGANDLETLDRKDIIRDQAPKNNRAFKQQWSALESLDLSNPPRRLVDGFSICYSSINPPPEPTTAEPGTIDDNQIDFNVARKRFLQIEQAKHTPVVQGSPKTPQSPALSHTPHSLATTYKTHSSAPSHTPISPVPTYNPYSPTPTHTPDSAIPTYTPDNASQLYTSQVPAQFRKYMFAEESSAATEDVSKDRKTTEHTEQHQTLSSQLGDVITISTTRTVTVIEDEKSMKRSNTTELDSGAGDQPEEDAAADGGVFKEEPGEETTSDSLPSVSQETPIEREIRIAQEREESLRRARGIRHSAMPEMVEIKTKSLLSQPTPPDPVRAVKAKEGNRVSFLIQREIEIESRREGSISGQAEGKGPGIYDVEERRRVFESQVKSSPSVPSVSASPIVSHSSIREGDLATEVFVSAEASEPTVTENGLLPCCPHRHTDEQIVLPRSRVSSSSSESAWRPRSRTSSGALASRIAAVVRWSTGDDSQSASPAPASSLPKQSSFFRGGTSARSSLGAFSSGSLSSLTDVGEDRERQSLPPWKRHMDQRLQNAPDMIRQEIERDMQREQEHLELRESSQNLSISLDKGLDDIDGSEQGITTATVTSTEGQSDLKQSSEEENATEPPSVPETELVPPAEPVKPVSSRPSYTWSVDTYPTRRISSSDKTLHTITPRPYSRLSSVSMVTAQPWGGQKPGSPVVPRESPQVPGPARVKSMEGLVAAPASPSAQKGLTETLLEDFEEHRIKMKLEESAYAGIQPIDDVNNEVLEATRVTRHKNTRALRWEAGMYANEDTN